MSEPISKFVFIPNGVVTTEECPVCGSETEVKHSKNNRHFCRCPECGDMEVIVGYDCPHCTPMEVLPYYLIDDCAVKEVNGE